MLGAGEQDQRLVIHDDGRAAVRGTKAVVGGVPRQSQRAGNRSHLVQRARVEKSDRGGSRMADLRAVEHGNIAGGQQRIGSGIANDVEQCAVGKHTRLRQRIAVGKVGRERAGTVTGDRERQQGRQRDRPGVDGGVGAVGFGDDRQTAGVIGDVEIVGGGMGCDGQREIAAVGG